MANTLHKSVSVRVCVCVCRAFILHMNMQDLMSSVFLLLHMWHTRVLYACDTYVPIKL